MSSILFYDGVCPKPYTTQTLHTEGMGGTEATVLRIASALTDSHTVYIKQRQRNHSMVESTSISYIPLEEDKLAKHDTIVTLRDAGHYLENKRQRPNAKHFLWLHDMPVGLYREHLLGHLAGQKAHIIAVSDYHKHVIIDNLKDIMHEGNIKVTRVYNPVMANRSPDNHINKNDLIYFSSPHKALDKTIELFRMIRRMDPSMRLLVANPGYYAGMIKEEPGVITLGSLPQYKVLEHVQASLALFYPNTSFPETFGLVMAEANAVGTPVITHPLGAAREVTYSPKELLDCRDYREVVDRVLAWKAGERPTVKAKPEFKIENVIKDWKKLV